VPNVAVDVQTLGGLHDAHASFYLYNVTHPIQ
jgi:hypothetical protein